MSSCFVASEKTTLLSISLSSLPFFLVTPSVSSSGEKRITEVCTVARTLWGEPKQAVTLATCTRIDLSFTLKTMS